MELLTITATGCVTVGILGGLVGIVGVIVAAWIVDWLRYR